ncbi:MAG TPA: helix-turn-helix domain-containing protein [Polyangiales bacterium]
MRQPRDTRGILRPDEGLRHFTLHRDPVPDDLAPYVEWMWGVRWDLPEGTSHRQETLPAPCVHLVFEQGAFRLHGPNIDRFQIELSGRGWVRGIRFTPAGFRAFHDLPVRALANRVVAAESLLVDAPSPPATFEEARPALLAYLRAHGPRPDPKIALLNELVRAAQSDGTLRVDDLAARARLSTRSLHRAFADYVGVSTKWIVRRARVHSAAERVAQGQRVDWAQLAVELGYSDQAHLIRDFRAQIGVTPRQYARRCGG